MTRMIPNDAKHYMLPDPFCDVGAICNCGWTPEVKVEGVDPHIDMWIDHFWEGNHGYRNVAKSPKKRLRVHR